MTTNIETSIASLTIKETYDKPRKCGNCERRRKVSVIEITGENATDTQQLCSACAADLEEAIAILNPPQGNDAANTAPNPVIMDGIAGILSGTTSVEQVLADADAILAPERYGLDGEADAILPPRLEQELDALDDVARVGKPAIGPEPGEVLPKIFTDVIRQRVADQHTAGATMPELAVAWGRTLGSIKKIIARLAPANA